MSVCVSGYYLLPRTITDEHGLYLLPIGVCECLCASVAIIYCHGLSRTNTYYIYCLRKSVKVHVCQWLLILPQTFTDEHGPIVALESL